MKSPNLPLVTERLRLRAFERGDLAAVAEYHALPEAQRYMDRKIRSQADVADAFEEIRTQRSLNRPGDTLSLAAVRASDDRLVGQVSLRWHDAMAAQAELRFVFNPTYQRHGYAAEAVKAALSFGFDEFSFHRIFTRCDARNQASARLLKSIGMRLEAHYREHALFQGEWDEELHFAVLDREWQHTEPVHEFNIHRVA